MPTNYVYITILSSYIFLFQEIIMHFFTDDLKIKGFKMKCSNIEKNCLKLFEKEIVRS